MPLFVATMPFGLRDFVEQEVLNTKAKIKKKEDRAIYFESSWSICYELNYTSRFISKILYSILDFTAYNEEELYANLKKHDFTKYIQPDQSIKIEAKSFISNAFHDQRFVAMKAKDAVVDQFYDKYGSRPDVDNKNPTLCLHIRVVKSQVNVSIDTSGEPLHERGYRKYFGEAPLKENVAACLVEHSGWSKEKLLVDPMCGVGTIPIEAARKALQIPTGYLRTFAFQNWLTFKEKDWLEVKEKYDTKIKKEKLNIKAFDISGQNIEKAKKNARLAGVEDAIEFQVADIEKLTLEEESGILICNPPYAERMSSQEEAEKLYKALGDLVHGKGNWHLWILSGNSDLTRAIRLKAEQKIPLKNGAIDCRLLHYPIY